MIKHKTKIIAGAVIVAVLAAAWLFGGNYSKGGDTPPVYTEETDRETEGASVPELPAATEPKASENPETSAPTPEKDEYPADPAPEGALQSAEPQDAPVGDEAFTCTLSVRCDTILNNMELLNKGKHEFVPKDGVVFPISEVTFYDGESVFDVLRREMERAKIHLEFMNTPIYNAAYIEGINNLYEFDAGELSGWTYKVNGQFPGYGSSRYQLRDGDVVEFVYTCDLGKDVGDTNTAGGRN